VPGGTIGRQGGVSSGKGRQGGVPSGAVGRQSRVPSGARSRQSGVALAAALTALLAAVAAPAAAAPAAVAPPVRSAQLEGRPVVRGPVPLDRAGGRLPWRLSGLVQRERVRVIGGARREDFPCLVLRHGGFRETRCLDGEPRLWWPLAGTTDELGADRGAAGRRYVLWGFAADPAAALMVRLGDGRRVRVPLRRLPRQLKSDARWFAWSPGRGDAIRHVTLLSRRGRRLARRDEPLPPAAVRGTYGIVLEVPPRPRGRATVAAGPLPDDPHARLLVRRVGARLCADIDRPNLEEPSCGPPPRRAVDSLIAARGTMRGDTAGGIVPPGVAEVALRGAPLSVAWARFPTQPAGPGLDRLRVFLGRIPFSGVVNLRLLDSTGATVFRDSLIPAYQTDDALEGATRPVRRGRARGGARFVLRGDPTGLCLAVTTPGRTRPEGGGSTCGLRGVELLVPCRPRLAAVVAPAAGRLRLRVLTAGGATRPGSLVRLPHGERAWFAPLPATASPRAVAWRDRRGRLRRVSLGAVPRPADQCGYAARPPS
jgi:hypothetical protein